MKSFEEIRANCPDLHENTCMREPDSPHDCEKGLCERLELSIRKRAKILEEGEEK